MIYGDRKIRVLFAHNSIPEYRIEFWRQLENKVDLSIMITQNGLEEKIYGFEKNINGLNIIYYTPLMKMDDFVETYDLVVLPPVDSLVEYKIALQLRSAAKRRKKKYIYWTEKWVPDIKKQPLKKRVKNAIQGWMIKSVAKDANCCIAAGSKSAEYYNLIGVGSSKVHIAFDSSTSPMLEKSIDIRERYKIKRKTIILYFGRIVARKGPDILIDACKNLLDKYNAVLLMCGEGEDAEKCKLQAKDSPVIFTGKIQPVERRAFYQQSDIFVLPSYCMNGVCEAWGLTVNEAIECGTPVIATTAVGAAYDILANGSVAGIMIEENNKNALETAIESVLSKNIAFSRDEIQEFYQRFSVEKMADSFFEVFKSLMTVSEN